MSMHHQPARRCLAPAVRLVAIAACIFAFADVGGSMPRARAEYVPPPCVYTTAQGTFRRCFDPSERAQADAAAVFTPVSADAIIAIQTGLALTHILLSRGVLISGGEDPSHASAIDYTYGDYLSDGNHLHNCPSPDSPPYVIVSERTTSPSLGPYLTARQGQPGIIGGGRIPDNGAFQPCEWDGYTTVPGSGLPADPILSVEGNLSRAAMQSLLTALAQDIAAHPPVARPTATGTPTVTPTPTDTFAPSAPGTGDQPTSVPTNTSLPTDTPLPTDTAIPSPTTGPTDTALPTATPALTTTGSVTPTLALGLNVSRTGLVLVNLHTAPHAALALSLQAGVRHVSPASRAHALLVRVSWRTLARQQRQADVYGQRTLLLHVAGAAAPGTTVRVVVSARVSGRTITRQIEASSRPT